MKLIILSVIISFGFIPTAADNDFDWLTEYHWHIADGRDFAGISPYAIDRNESFLARFRRLELPPGSVLLEERRRLRFVMFDEIRFMLLYQMREDINTLHIVENSYFSNGVYSLEWSNNFNRVSRNLNGRPDGLTNRVGGQVNRSFPIVGEWWRNREYRIVNPRGIIYYVEIERFPGWAIRPGIYPLKQVGDNVFETVSSFPDGRLRLEILREAYFFRDGRFVLLPIIERHIEENTMILVTPLFSGEEEEELMYPLVLWRSRFRIQDYE